MSDLESGHHIASVEGLVADGSRWATLASMGMLDNADMQEAVRKATGMDLGDILQGASSVQTSGNTTPQSTTNSQAPTKKRSSWKVILLVFLLGTLVGVAAVLLLTVFGLTR